MKNISKQAAPSKKGIARHLQTFVQSDLGLCYQQTEFIDYCNNNRLQWSNRMDEKDDQAPRL